MLDESSDAAARARANSVMLAKFKERMSRIKRALYVRTIVDDDDEGEGGGGGGGEGDAVSFLGAGGDEDDGASSGVARDSLAASPRGIGAARGEDDAATDAPPAPTSAAFAGRSIITIEEEDDGDDADEGGGGCRDAPRGHPTRAAAEGGAEGGPTTTTPSSSRSSSTSTSSDSSPRGASPATSRTAPPRDPPRPSLPSPRRYTDALNCGGLRRPHYAEALSCASASSSCGNAGGSPATVGGAGCGAAGRSRSSPSSSPDAAGGGGGISLSAIVTAYGEECNICLSQFQVGDHAAWSSNRRGGGGAGGGGAAVVCSHVFHEECITRWLLVRDRCPICRESYFPAEDAPPAAAGAIAAADVPATADRAGGGDGGPDLERGENSGDDGVSDVEIRSTPLVRRMIERFGPAT